MNETGSSMNILQKILVFKVLYISPALLLILRSANELVFIFVFYFEW